MELTLKDLTPEQVIKIAEFMRGDTVTPLNEPTQDEVKAVTDSIPDATPELVEPTAAEVFTQEVLTEPEVPVTEPEPVTPAPDDNGLDAAGIPWDERIHSSSKAKTVKGVWKKRKGLQAHIYDAVMAELTGKPAPAPAPAPADNVVTMPAPAKPAPAPAEPAPAPTGLTLPEIMMRVTSGQVDQATVMNTLAKHGLKSIAMLGARPDLIPVISKELFNE